VEAFNNRTRLIFTLGEFATSYVQEMQAHLGMTYCPDAERAVVLGSGYGITAGTLGLYPGLSRIDAVEIIPGLVAAAELFEPYNHGYQKNPRIHVVLDDARHFMARADVRYDIVSANVTDPHQPGGSGLLHEEFYTVVKQHLTERGVLVQHAFSDDLPIVLATLRHAFPFVAYHTAYRDGFNVVAATHPLDPSRTALARVIAPQEVQNSLRSLGLAAPVDPAIVLTTQATRAAGLDAQIGASPIATDDFPILELSYSGGPRQWLFSNQ
jgi:spermidine synthase